MHGCMTGGIVPLSGKIEVDGFATERVLSSAAVRRRMLTIITENNTPPGRNNLTVTPKIGETQMHGCMTGGIVPLSGKIEVDRFAMERVLSSAAVRRRMLTIITEIAHPAPEKEENSLGGDAA